MGKLRTLSLFAGIGGFDLGLERTNGFETVAFCEIDPFCRKVLAKHWPKVPCYEDVRELTGARLAADGIAVDVIAGGFPCQDVSIAGGGAGVDGERSVLWREYARIIGELRPRFAIMENSPALLARGAGKVFGELAALGYDAEWHCIPAAAVGADHLRDRFWLVAHPNEEFLRDKPGRRSGTRRKGAAVARDDGQARSLAHRNEGHRNGRNRPLQMGWGASASETLDAYNEGRTQWPAQSGVGRVVHGVSNRVDRCGALGNSIVPSIATLIGHAILASIQQDQALAEVA